jgi:hypothetical protein
MYSTKLINKSMVSGNAYITVGDPYVDPKANPFRAPKKGEKEPNPFRTTVSSSIFRGNNISTYLSFALVVSSIR